LLNYSSVQDSLQALRKHGGRMLSENIKTIFYQIKL